MVNIFSLENNLNFNGFFAIIDSISFLFSLKLQKKIIVVTNIYDARATGSLIYFNCNAI